ILLRSYVFRFIRIKNADPAVLVVVDHLKPFYFESADGKDLCIQDRENSACRDAGNVLIRPAAGLRAKTGFSSRGDNGDNITLFAIFGPTAWCYTNI
ncbi:MAG: hypothetical protein PVF11_03355, partial [Desulfobacterales bacterium]